MSGVIVFVLALVAALGGVFSPAAMAAQADQVWGRSYFPNVMLTGHDGKTYRFFDDLIADKVVVINFIYTHCPDVCPLETTRLKQVHQLLRERMGKDVFMYSITIDPERDTAQVLSDYVERFAVPQPWLFLTGAEADVIALRQKLGVYIEDIQAADSNDHNVSLVIGNQATGRWMQRSPFENPYVLAAQIGGELHNWKLPRDPQRNYARAPELRNISPAEQLFRTRCSTCHTIGGAHGDTYGGTRDTAIGPDLYNVTARRDRRWLLRWIAQPDVMLAEKDPVAIALFEQYNRVPMPNLRLSLAEVESVLSFIDQESRRIQRERRQQRAAAGAGF